MSTLLPKQETLAAHSCCTSRKAMRERAVELAGAEGRAPHDASKSDWEQAKHELTGEPDPREPLDEAESESGCWDLDPGARQNLGPASSDGNGEDDERLHDQRLEEDGARETGHDQMLRAAIFQSQEDE